MRTSYKRGSSQYNHPVENRVEKVKKPTESECSVEDFESNSIYEQIATGYAELKNNLDLAQDIKEEEIQNVVVDSSSEGKGKKHKKEKNGKLAVKVSVTLAVVLVTVGSVAIASRFVSIPGIFSASQTEPYVSQLEEISNCINSLYVDESKSDIAVGYSSSDLEVFYSKLSEAANKGEDTSELVAELNTISQYMTDSAQLLIYEDKEYDLSTETLYDGLLKIKESSNVYVIDGLKTTIGDRVTSLLAEIDEYKRIKSVLTDVEDANSINFDSLNESIDVIKHTKNNEELKKYLSELESNKVAETSIPTEASLSEESVPKTTEG